MSTKTFNYTSTPTEQIGMLEDEFTGRMATLLDTGKYFGPNVKTSEGEVVGMYVASGVQAYDLATSVEWVAFEQFERFLQSGSHAISNIPLYWLYAQKMRELGVDVERATQLRVTCVAPSIGEPPANTQIFHKDFSSTGGGSGALLARGLKNRYVANLFFEVTKSGKVRFWDDVAAGTKSVDGLVDIPEGGKKIYNFYPSEESELFEAHPDKFLATSGVAGINSNLIRAPHGWSPEASSLRQAANGAVDLITPDCFHCGVEDHPTLHRLSMMFETREDPLVLEVAV